MTSIQDAAFLDGLGLRELRSGMDERTLQILEHRRRAGTVRRRGWLVRRLLLAADVLGLAAAIVVAEVIFTTTTNSDSVQARWEILALVASLPCWVVVAKLYGLYDKDEERTDHSTADEFAAVFHMVTVCTFLFWAWSRLSHVVYPQPAKLIIFWASAVTLVTLGRVIARSFARRSVSYLQNTVIVGAGEVGQTVARKLLNHPEYGINLVGFVDAEPKERGPGLEHLAVLGDAQGLPALVKLFDIDRVIVAFSNDSHDATLDLIRELKDHDVQIDIVPRLYELMSSSVGIHSVEGVALVGLAPFRLSHSSRFLKRALDLALTIPALIVMSPLFAAVALLIRLDSPGPVFFRQTRMGCGDETFRIFKFRSMTADADQRKHEVAHLNQHLSPGGDPRMFKVRSDPRVTRVGSFLRRTSLDELPQLVNVLTGEMSLVGPRPLILDEDRHVARWARRRLDLKPGITGLWQVLGRDGIPFEEMTRLDYIYVTGWSLFGDMKLLFRTFPVVFARNGK